MSISDRPQRGYAFEKGMLNIAWVSGFARHIARGEQGLTGFIQQNNDVTRMLPIGQMDKSRVFAGVADCEPIKIIGRIHARIEDGTRTVFIDPLEISSPSIIEMPSDLAWHSPIQGRDPNKIEQDDFQPFHGSIFGDGRLREAANSVRIAGIVDGVLPLREKAGQGPVVGLEVLVRQTANPDHAIPVRMMNSAVAAIFRNELRLGRPVLVHGKLRVRDEYETDQNGVTTPTGRRIGYVFCRTILNARRDKDIITIPAWVSEILARYGKKVEPEADQETGSAAAEHDEPAQAAPSHAEEIERGLDALVDGI